jgi:hypothetical protein
MYIFLLGFSAVLVVMLIAETIWRNSETAFNSAFFTGLSFAIGVAIGMYMKFI